jgi:hypothetical protein
MSAKGMAYFDKSPISATTRWGGFFIEIDSSAKLESQMSQSSTGLSKHERRCSKAAKKPYHSPDPSALLWTRQHSCRALSCSLATIIRLEDAGKLDKIKLDPDSPNALTYHRPAQVKALAGVR